MLGTTEPDEKDIWIGWCRGSFTNEASYEICIAISVRKILYFSVLQSLWNRYQSVELYWWQWQLTWETNEAYNGIWITRTVEMTVLSFNKKKNIYPLLTFAFGKKLCRFRKNWSDWFKQQKSTITSDVGCWFSITMIRVRGCPLMILLKPLLTLLL